MTKIEEFDEKRLKLLTIIFFECHLQQMKNGLNKKHRTVGTTGIAWSIRETTVSKEIHLQVCSIPKNLPLQTTRKGVKWRVVQNIQKII